MAFGFAMAPPTPLLKKERNYQKSISTSLQAKVKVTEGIQRLFLTCCSCQNDFKISCSFFKGHFEEILFNLVCHSCLHLGHRGKNRNLRRYAIHSKLQYLESITKALMKFGNNEISVTNQQHE